MSNSPSILTINVNPLVFRVLLLLPAILAVVGGWFAIHWYLGDVIAEFAPDNDKGGQEVAALAVKWAPDDPFTHFTMGNLKYEEFGTGQLADAVREFETAVSLAPNDYRYWTQLGRALEATGDSDKAEKALRRAVALAPSYSFPRWYLGNLLLRLGKQDEALGELVRASQADTKLLPQVFNLTWELFAGNVDEVARISCTTPSARAELAVYCAQRKEFDQGMRMWSTLNGKEKRAAQESGELLKKVLLEAGKFHHVLVLMHDLEMDLSRIPEPEKIFNPGFEIEIGSGRADKFGWVLITSTQTQMSIDHLDKYSGNSSLKIVFKSPTNLNAIDASQLLVVQPDTQYRLECYVRTDDLRTGGPPLLEIRDAADRTVLAASPPIQVGTNNWVLVGVDFKTHPQMEGVVLRMGRATCGYDTYCPIFGTVWYDDFNLKRSNSPAARDTAGAGSDSGNAARPN